MRTAQKDGQTQSPVVLPSSGKPPRLPEVDILRGIVMILMALDHVRFFLMPSDWSPTDLVQASTWHFLTFWVTRFCAPVFVFLAGASVFLRGIRESRRAVLAGFLLTRGLWLILLQLTAVDYSWTFVLETTHLEGGILWVIGCALMVMAGLMFLPRWAILAVGVALISSHPLLVDVPAERFGQLHWLYVLLHEGETIVLLPGVSVCPAYPLLPWIGLMALGYSSAGQLLTKETRRRFWLVGLGAVLILMFLALRWLNVYGDLYHWTKWPGTGYVVLSFLNCDDYPPLLFLMVLGPALMFLTVPAVRWGWLGKFWMVFGQVPLFFYLLHIPLIHLVAMGYSTRDRGTVSFPLDPSWQETAFEFPVDDRDLLLVVYLVWIGVILSLFPLCLCFGRLKKRKAWWWLSYV